MIPVIITAKNEENSILNCINSLSEGIESLKEKFIIKLVIVLDDCTDKTESIVRKIDNLEILKSSGGIVEAQRIAWETFNNCDFIIFSDADILIEKEALNYVIKSMMENKRLKIAYPKKSPITPKRSTPLANALYIYNKHNGFQTKRQYFNGRFFAVRDWYIPTTSSLMRNIESLEKSNFYRFEDGIRADDIFLSRHFLSNFGSSSIKEIDLGGIYYHPPETYRGMYRTYRRMRMEIERLNLLLPDSEITHRNHGVRKYDIAKILKAKISDVVYWYIFRFFLQICKCHYFFEKMWYQNLTNRKCPAWEVIEESKPQI
jgi:glycosyltransferase involved in cell wall biosynthesis